MFLHRAGWVILIGILIVLSGCNAEEKEFESYFDQMKGELSGEDSGADKDIKVYIEHVQNGKPKEALDVLSEQVIPSIEEDLQNDETLDLNNEDLVNFNEHLKEALKLDLKKQNAIKDIFEKVMENQDAKNIEEIGLDSELAFLYKINEEIHAEAKKIKQGMDNLVEKYDFIEVDNPEAIIYDTMDTSEINDGNNAVILAFIKSATGITADKLGGGVNPSPQEKKQETTSDEKNIEALLADQGNPEVVFDAEVEIIDDTFRLNGKSNLIEGSTVMFHTYQYGTENPYLKDKLQVDENGDFGLELDMRAIDLQGEPLTMQLAFQPDKEGKEVQELYGEEGEKIEGRFVHKFTSTKRTRFGAFTYANIELRDSAKATFGTEKWEKPDDYGDPEIWMEKKKIETKDDYYVITMNSNLNELTGIKAEVKVPGYETAGYTSRTTVMPDGSFRLHVPRPDVKEEVIIVMEATSDRAIETEELYGEDGEEFKGGLVEKTKKGQKIVYELHLGNNS